MGERCAFGTSLTIIINISIRDGVVVRMWKGKKKNSKMRREEKKIK